MQEETKTEELISNERAETYGEAAEVDTYCPGPEQSNRDLISFALRESVVADLSSQALRGWYIYSILDAAVRLVAEALGVELCSVYRMDESGDSLRLVAGTGWGGDVVGNTTVGANLESHAGFTIRAGVPVIVEDFSSEERFKASDLLVSRGVVSSISVPMIAGNFIFGTMSAHTTKSRKFSKHETNFLETVANILTIAALRRQAVAALRQSSRGLKETKQYLSNVIETSSDAIVSTNTDGKVVLCNKGAENLLGYQRQELVGRSMAVLFETEEEAKKIHGILEEGGGTVAGLETTLVTKDKTRIPVSVSASLFYSEKGEVTGSVCFNRDIRDRIRWQQELEQINEEIVETQNALKQAQAEADAVGDLRKVNEELKRQMKYTKKAQEQLVTSEKMIALGRLTAGVSHEILNPLNIIAVRLHMMLTDPDTPPEILKKLKTLDEQAQRIAKITEGLLDYSRKRKPDRSKINFNEAVMRTLDLVVHDFKNANITVVLWFDTNLPALWADRDQLQQVVLNLFTNARDAMPRGGQLTLSTSAVQKNGQRYLELKVEDSGPGIPKENLDRLFDPFFTTKPEGEGTGLGLSICQGIVEAHGGFIFAENETDGGAVFTVRLPLQEPESEEVSKKP